MQPRLFVSDLHLAPDRKAEAAAFRAFCAGPARNAGAVYILGDLFDWWIGDDQLRDRFFGGIATTIRTLTEGGVPVYIAHGNRDFLLGDRFAKATGAALLPERQLVDIAGELVLVSHGDELCTGDVEYQAYRARMRNPATQRRLLRLPTVARRLIAHWLRRKSRNATAMKAESIMDVDAHAVEAAFREHGVRRIVHGHTHRPATHRLVVDDTPRERIVLADWHGGGEYVALDGRDVTRVAIHG